MASDTLRKINLVAADHFSSPGLELNELSTAADVEGWDSFSHIEFMMRLEAEFGIRFKTAEMSGIRNVGELVERISARLR